MSRQLRITALAFVVLLGLSSQAKAAGGSSVPLEDVGGQGVAAADGSYRYVALRESFGGGSETTLLKINQDGGHVVKQRTITGDFGIPSVTFDSTPTGLSHDGSVLALIKPRLTYRRKTTEFLIIDAKRLGGGPGQFVLEGDFSLDAISPDGETLYLIEHPNPKDFTSYQVRSFDIATGKLDPEPILDSEEEPGEMRGFPQTRVTSDDGRWEYTLYDGGEHPFIHALDVVEGATVCIDVEMIKARDTFGATLEMGEGGDSIELTDRKGDLRAVVDTETFQAREPDAPAEPEAASAEPSEPGMEVAGIAIGGVAIAALGAIAIRRRRRE